MSKPITAGQQAFLDAYRYSGMVKEAAAQAGCSRELHYGAMRTSETYREAFALVQRDLSYELEEEARRRAVDGVKIPILYRGKVVGYDIRYSDALLVFLLEANDPEKFGGIRKELARNQDGFCVRWDQEGGGRPRRPTMNVPLPPQPPGPPMPPRPPRPPVGECSEPVPYAEWAAARGYADFSERGPIDPEKLARWITGDNLGPVEWVPEEPGADLVEEGDPGWESDESDGGFCVRWEEVEPDQQNDGAALQASEDVSGDVTRLGGPGWETGWPFRPEEKAECIGTTDCQVGSRWSTRASHGEDAATVGRFCVRKRFRRGEGRAPAPRQAVPSRMSNGRRLPFGHALSRGCHGVHELGPPLSKRWWHTPPHVRPPEHRPLASQPP